MAWTAATRGDYVRLNGSFASDVRARDWTLMAPSLGGAARQTSAVAVTTAGGERDLLSVADRLPVADAAAGLPAAQHGLRLLACGSRPGSGRAYATALPRGGRWRSRAPDEAIVAPVREDQAEAREAGSPATPEERGAFIVSSRLVRADARVGVHQGRRSGPRRRGVGLDRHTRGFPFIERFFADAGYQGPRAAAATPRPFEIIKRTDTGFVV